jgi:hypothetical protein
MEEAHLSVTPEGLVVSSNADGSYAGRPVARVMAAMQAMRRAAEAAEAAEQVAAEVARQAASAQHWWAAACMACLGGLLFAAVVAVVAILKYRRRPVVETVHVETLTVYVENPMTSRKMERIVDLSDAHRITPLCSVPAPPPVVNRYADRPTPTPARTLEDVLRSDSDADSDSEAEVPDRPSLPDMPSLPDTTDTRTESESKTASVADAARARPPAPRRRRNSSSLPAWKF